MKSLTRLVICFFLPVLLLASGCVSSKPGYARERVERTRRHLGKVETCQRVGRIRPYALMSELAYQGDRITGERRARQDDFRRHLESAGWRLLTNRTDSSFTNENSPGLHFYVWENRSLPKPHLVVAFRGTEFKDSLDWRANARWLLPFSRRQDQYEQARQDVFEYLQRQLSPPDTNVVIVTTGHSLGAGLAQSIFYSSYSRVPGSRVTQCYAFDPSPVTGALQLGTGEQRKAARDARQQTQARLAGDKVKGEPSLAHFDFGIVRVYEGGEILAYPRSLLRQFWPLHPLIAELRFDFTDRGHAVGQHAMSVLAESLYTYPACDSPKP
jgi:hypothetical protein